MFSVDILNRIFKSTMLMLLVLHFLLFCFVFTKWCEHMARASWAV